MSRLTTPAPPARRVRLARAAVAAQFLTNGAVFFNVVPRYPQIREDLGLSNAALGAAIAAFPVGALLAGLFAGAVVRRYRSARVAAFGIVLTTTATLAIPLAPNLTALAGALFLVGAVDSVVDVAQNTHGLRVQRLYGRSIVNSLHGVWSIGAVLGGLMGSAAAGLNLPLGLHLTVSAVLLSAVALIAHHYMLPGDDTRSPTAGTDAAADGPEPDGAGMPVRAAASPHPPADTTAGVPPDAESTAGVPPDAESSGGVPADADSAPGVAGRPVQAAPGVAGPVHATTGVAGRPMLATTGVAGRPVHATAGAADRPVHATAGVPGRGMRAAAVRLLALLGVLAACGVLVEDAGASWGAIFLTDELHTGAATAGLAVVALQTAMTIGRLTGDRAVDRFGQRTVVRAGAALGAAGMAAALAFPSVPTALAGFALAGLGVATLVPAAMHTADELPGLRPGTGLTVVSWLLRGGFLLSPLLVGYLADQAGLRVGLLTVVAAGVITVILARVLVNRTSPATP
ncbi:MFS transporter [Actinoplanes utahensis]|uniref:Fucose permease n=1 Tax=Actinoplanes utahensis TaxID=1869 RepID=A0A0A6UET4_ACTUT|nr:MFS transporter [Actinoplanes utahensis]KHD73603.1 fucose permease [Actinoplanes utahensis]GIF33961.1 hypothetical protein Aut01nite_69470 [Actinoplanes utahensis]